MTDTEQKLKKLFDLQEFNRSPKRDRLIAEAGSGNAAGIGTGKTQP